MVQQELANLAEMVWALLHSAQRDGQCFYPSQRAGDYVGAFSFCGLTALLGRNGDVRLRAHDLDVVLAHSDDGDSQGYLFDLAGSQYSLAFHKGHSAFLRNWYSHITGLQGCFHSGMDTARVAL